MHRSTNPLLFYERKNHHKLTRRLGSPQITRRLGSPPATRLGSRQITAQSINPATATAKPAHGRTASTRTGKVSALNRGPSSPRNMYGTSHKSGWLRARPFSASATTR
jgi:hypothetical protein